MASSPQERVEAIMRHYDPDKVSTVPVMLERYKGKEHELIQALVKRYGPEPKPGAKAPAGKAPAKGKKTPAASPAGKKAAPSPAAAGKKAKSAPPAASPAKKGAAPAASPAGKKAAPTASPAKKAAPAAASPTKTKTKAAAGAPTASPAKSKKAPPSGTASPKKPPGSANRTPADRVTALMQHYDPGKAHTVPVMLDKYNGKEDELLQALVKRYGPEPPATPSAGGAAAKTPAKTPVSKQSASPTKTPLGGKKAPPAASPAKLAKAPPAASTPTKKSATPTSGTPQRTPAQRAEAMMRHYEPSKVGTVPVMLEKYKGKEEDLVQALVKRYGPEPPAADPAPAKTPAKTPSKTPAKTPLPSKTPSKAPTPGGGSSPAPSTGKTPPAGMAVDPKDYLTRVRRILEKYEPTKVQTAPAMVDRYKGKEGELLEALRKRYGPEPPLIVPPAAGGAKSSPASPADAGKAATAAPPATSPAPKKAPPASGGASGAKQPAPASAASPTRPAAAATGGQSSVDSIPMPERVERVMRHYEPAKAGTTPAMLAKFKGKEQDLLTALTKRYGPEPTLEQLPRSSAAATTAAASPTTTQPAAQAASSQQPAAASPTTAPPAAAAAAPASPQAPQAATPTPGNISGLSTASPTPSATTGDDTSIPLGPTAVPAGVTAPAQMPTDVRIRRLLLRYEPKKVANAEKMLQRYVGREEKLVEALTGRLGPEPGIDFMPAGYQGPASAGQQQQGTAATTVSQTVAPSQQQQQQPSQQPAVQASPQNMPPSTTATGEPASASATSTSAPTATVAGAPSTIPPAAANFGFDERALQPPAVAQAPAPLSAEEVRRRDVRKHLDDFCAMYAPDESQRVQAAFDAAGLDASEELVRQLHRKHGVPLVPEEPAWVDDARRMAMEFGLGEHFVASLINEYGADEGIVRGQLLATLFPDFMLHVLADERQIRGFVAQRLARFLSVFAPDRVSSVGAILQKYEGGGVNGSSSLASSLGDTMLKFHGDVLKRGRLHTVHREAVIPPPGGQSPHSPTPAASDGTTVPGIYTTTQLREHADVWALQRSRGRTPDFTGQRAPVLRLLPVAHASVETDLLGDIAPKVEPPRCVTSDTQTEEPPRFAEPPRYDPERDERLRTALTTNFAEARRLRAQELYGTTAAQREALSKKPLTSAFSHRDPHQSPPRDPEDAGPDPSWTPGASCNSCAFYRRQVAELQQQIRTLQTVTKLRKLELEERFEGGECRDCLDKSQQIRKLQERLHLVRTQRDARAAGNYLPLDQTYEAPTGSLPLPLEGPQPQPPVRYIGALSATPQTLTKVSLRDLSPQRAAGEHDGSPVRRYPAGADGGGGGGATPAPPAVGRAVVTTSATLPGVSSSADERFGPAPAGRPQDEVDAFADILDRL